MQRRTFILSGVGAILGAGALRLALSDQRSAVAKILHRRLDYLNLDPQGVAQFAQDIVNHGISGSKLTLVDAMGPLYTRLDLLPNSRVNVSLRHGEERITSKFLLSSDFFDHGADTSRLVRYLGYFERTDLRACSSPFARPPPDDAAHV